jgi:hypothetical protein
MDTNKTPLEEQIIQKWLGTLHRNDQEKANKIYRKQIGTKWGLLYDKSVKTIQHIDYTNKTLKPEQKYKFCHRVEHIMLDDIYVDLLFTFAPNFNNDPNRPTMYFTCEPPNNNNLYYKRQALKTSIMTCLLNAKPGHILIPYLGGGVNQCFLVPDEFLKLFLQLTKNKNKLTNYELEEYSILDIIARYNYYKLIEDICNEFAEIYPPKYLDIYVML